MDKKKVLVVGAGSGIGEALFARLVSSTNFEVYGISRRGKFFSDEIIPSINYHCDVTKEQDINSFFRAYKSSKERIDALYLCQGDGLFGEISSLTRESLESHFQLNVFSQIYILQNSYPLLLASQNSFVCFLSSTAGKVGFPESTAYCASKHAVAGLAKSLREEWKKDKIRVMTVYPGAISTPIWNDRKEFNTEDMIAPNDFAIYLETLLTIPSSINVEDSYTLPLKGIL